MTAVKKIETFGKIEDGKLLIVYRSRFLENLKLLRDGHYRVIVERIYKKRSNPQNAYLWGVVYPLILQGLKDLGYELVTPEQVHELMKFKFLQTEIANKDGEYIETIRSTTELTTTEFMDYLAEIWTWSKEYLNIYIPEPNEKMEMESF